MTEAAAAMAAIRLAQPSWAQRPVQDRLAIIKHLRRSVAADARACAATAMRPNMSEADILVAEVMPFLAACRFLEKQATAILKPGTPAGGRPVWLMGTKLTVRRVPFGAVLILAPRNYPLLLPGIQVLQALVAGNGVMVKPAPGFAAPMLFLATALHRAGLPEGVLAVLPDSHAAGSDALQAGADKVVLTGSGETGRLVLNALADTVTPATMELSGDDALIVLPGAPINIVAEAIRWSLMLNGGETCIAPRRIIAVGEAGPALAERLRSLSTPPVITLGARPENQSPPFDATAHFLTVPDAQAAVALANSSRHALGAVVFGPSQQALALAEQLRAGCIVVNDVIVPTSDPRLPFGGAGASGFGVTRGAEGLLEMTRPQAIVRRGKAMGVQYRLLPPSAVRWIARGLRLLYG